MGIYQDYAELRIKIGALQKSGKNPHFKSTYVKLNTVLDEIDKHIKDSGFVCFIQLPVAINGKNYLHTELIHGEGEKIECDLELITTKQDPQMLGSSLTYMRRYSLITLLGLQDDDDDGNVGSGKEEKKQEPKQEPKPKTEAEKLFDDVKSKGMDKQWQLAKARYKVSSGADLTKEQIDEIRKDLGL
jgi:hypothetical protein